jgi:hypothetical protein
MIRDIIAAKRQQFCWEVMIEQAEYLKSGKFMRWWKNGKNKS